MAEKKTVKCTQNVMRQCSYGRCGEGSYLIHCEYILIEGHSRGCPAECCDKFTTKQVGKKKC